MRKILSATAAIVAMATQPVIADERAVILIIGDGFDDTHVTMGRNYLKGQAGQLLLDQMPFRGAVQVETVNSEGTPIYVADSANTATALATGAVTQIARIGKNAADQPVKTVLESAAAAGYKTGIVSTASVTDASPAAFAAHVTIRACENPVTIRGGEKYGVTFDGCPEDLKENGGMGSISEQLAVANVDVILGGGMEHFVAQYESDPTALALAQQQGVTILTERDALEQQHAGRVIGLFSEDTMPVAWRGTNGRIAESIERSWLNHLHEMIGSVTQPEIIECEANPSFAEMPSMEMMTRYALDHLSRDNDKGFFLTIESASIDKKSHERDACGSIGEIKQLEEALAAAMEYASDNPNTPAMVTADHSQVPPRLCRTQPCTPLYPSLFSVRESSAYCDPRGQCHAD